MDSKRLSNLERLMYRVVLIVWIISAIVMLFSLSSIDMIVNTDLYNYGLQLSANWLLPYWTYIRLNYALLSLSLVLSLFALATGFIRKNERVVENVARTPSRLQPVSQESALRTKNGDLPKADSATLISCSACGREFSRPMVSLSVEGGKNRLVNVCPYCNHVLCNEGELQQKANNI
jgi:DNA-directed RNA polymerase subunit RPC12/RpoP